MTDFLRGYCMHSKTLLFKNLFTKRIVVINSIILLLTMALTPSCGVKLGEKNKTENVAELKSTKCLSQSLAQLKLFFSGDASSEQVSESLLCLQNVLREFKENIRGKNEDAYSPEEMSHFLTSHFLKEGTEISAGFLAEVMKFKSLLVGGDAQSITKSEIDGLIDIIKRLEPELIKLTPHMKIIVSRWVPDMDSAISESKFIAAQDGLAVFLNHIGLLLASTQRDYEIDDLLNLTIEVVKFVRASDSGNTSGNDNEGIEQTIDKARAFILKFKKILIGGSTRVVGNEWIPFNRALGEIYFQSLRFKYFLSNLNHDQDDQDQQIDKKWRAYALVTADMAILIRDLLTFKNTETLSNKEIVDLLGTAKFLMTNIIISDEQLQQLVHQVGLFKVIILGNHADGNGALAWSKTDFSNLSLKAPVVFKSLAVVLKNIKHLKINEKKSSLKKGVDNKKSYEEFAHAEVSVVKAVYEMSQQISAAYSLDSLQDLIVNLSQTLLKDKLKLPDNFTEIFVLAQSAKYTLTGEPGAEVSKHGIQLLLNIGVRAYMHYIEYTKFVKLHGLNSKEFIYNFDKLFKKIKETSALELSLKKSHLITASEVIQLILTAQKQKFLDSEFDEKALDSLFRALLGNILNTPGDRLSKIVLPGINEVALQTIAMELSFWIENQRVITEIFTDKGEFTKESLLQELTSFQQSLASSLALKELISVVSVNGLMNFNEKSYLKILTSTNGFYHWQDLSKTNLMRALARLLIRSYANDLVRVNNLTGLTLEEVQSGFDQLSEFIFSLGLVERENIGFVSSRFREANLFLSTSNGDNLASFEEMHHLFLHILSGMQRADSLKVIATQKCLKVVDHATPVKIEFKQDCLLDLYFNEENAFAELPEFSKLKSEKNGNGDLILSPEKNKDYYLSLLMAAGYIPNDKISNDQTPNEERTVPASIADLFPHAVQYVEMIYFTHDINRDGYLQKDEAIKAYPIFAETMKPVQKQLNLTDNELIGFFVWLLKKGSLFPILTMKKFVKDYECNLRNDSKTCAQDWTINSSRVDVGKVLSLIAEVSKPAPPTKP